MSLKDIALPLIERGIRVIPARPGERASTLPNWPDLATKDPKVIEQWDKQYPDWNLVCVANLEDNAIVDFDDLRAAQKLGLPRIPATFTSQSPRPGYHVFLRHTARSRALGNRTVRNGTGTIAELKAHRASVCAPGCTRADGGRYVVYDPSEIVDVPDALCDWFELYDPRVTPKGCRPVSDDFDFDDFLDFYGIEVFGGGPWYYPRYCPVKGEIHTNGGKPDLRAAAFYFDGETLGWKDLAASCPGAEMRIGGLIKFLNAQQGEPYRGKIWDNDQLDASQFWDDVEGVADAEEVPSRTVSADEFARALNGTEVFPTAAAVSPAKEKCYRVGCHCGLEHVYQSNLCTSTRAAIDEALAMASDEETRATVEEAPVTLESPAKTVLSVDEIIVALSPARRKRALVEEWGLTDIPEHALYGSLGEIARKLELPVSIAYPAVLTAFSAISKENEILYVQCNLYCALMMGVGGGKNIALTRATRALNMRYEIDYMDATLGRAGGLFQAIGNKTEGRGKDKVEIPGPRKMLINPAEFAATMINITLDKSTLAPHLTNLWDKTRISMPVREGKREIDCRLSILGALPVEADKPETFTRYFGKETADGLYSRFLFGYTKQKIDHRWAERWKWDPPRGDEDLAADLGPPTTPPAGWSKEAEDYFSELELYGDVDGRGLYNLKRIALLTSMANGDKFVSLDAVKSAELFMLWQGQLKRHFRHGQAEQLKSGELSTIILDTLRRIDAEGKYERSPVIEGRLQISIPRVIHNNNWEKYGADVVVRLIDALVKAGQLQYGLKYAAGKPGSGKDRVVVKSNMHVVVVQF